MTSHRLTTWADLAVGQKAGFSKVVTEADISHFIAITGDVNPLHVSDAFAGRTFFKQRIVHGMLSASLFSTIVGMLLPGTGAIYKSQNLEFVRPVFIGDELTATFQITAIDTNGETVEMAGTIVNQHGDTVIRGEATAGLLRGFSI